MEPHRHEPPVPLAVALTFLVGVGVAVQAFCNGRLAKELGSLEIAGLANMVTGGALLVTLAAAGGALRRALLRVRAGAGLRWWMFVGGFSGALVVIVTTKAAPEIGVALMTVAIVCGQSGGSLLVDRVGLSPAGHQPVSAPRLVGVALAIAAVVVGGLSARTEPKPVLLGAPRVRGLLLRRPAGGQRAVGPHDRGAPGRGHRELRRRRGRADRRHADRGRRRAARTAGARRRWTGSAACWARPS